VTTRYVAQLFEAMGVDRVVTMDVHNLAAFQNAFRRPTEHLEAAALFVDHVIARLDGGLPVVVSPDAGGVKRADRFRSLLATRLHQDVPMAFLEKYRSSGVVSGEAVVGETTGRVAVIIDDLISSGVTMARAAAACRRQGATGVLAIATHGVFSSAAPDVLADKAFDDVAVTDTVPVDVGRRPGLRRVTVLDSTGLVAEAISRLHTNRSMVDLVG
jgi:ribose-phosphate pyrophosphokinase